MINITPFQLKIIMPSLETFKAVEFAGVLNESMAKFGIDLAVEARMFLANIAHESGEFRWMQEIWGPTSEQLTYERDFTQPWGPQLKRGNRNFKAFTLGNGERGDGRKFSGHGPIQVTGYTNHVIMGFILEQDFIDKPWLLCEPYWGCMAAAAFWYNNNLDPKAQKGFVPVVKAINGGTNGLADRQKYLERAKAVIK